MLADLARSNMFLVSLDARGEWYRYHHLFGEVLQLELGREAARELRRRAWCLAQGLVEEAIEYAAAAGDADVVAELLIERHLEFIWGGRLRQLLGWVRWLPAELLVQHPVLPVSAASAAALLAAPDVEVQRFLAVAERARRERPNFGFRTSRRARKSSVGVIERGDVGAAVGRARRAVAAAEEGADMLSASALACLAQALFFAGELDEARRVAVQAVERPTRPTSPTPTSDALGCSRWSTASRNGLKAGRRRLGRRWRSRASTSRPTRGLPHWRIWGWPSHAHPQDASTRPSARRYAASVCDARHSRPSASARAARPRSGAAGAIAAGARR